MTQRLLSPIQTGRTVLANHVVTASLTRSRAGQPGGAPTGLNVTYCTQHATAGLIVTEAMQISRRGQGYAWAPDMHIDTREASWKTVVDTVHAKGGRISQQLWHVGRISNTLLQGSGQAPVAPSAIVARGTQGFVVQPDGMPASVPTNGSRALATGEVPGVITQYRQAVLRARHASFGFIEVHAANGYLLHQFLSANGNQRADQYGDSLENRTRLILEVVDTAIAEIGAGRVDIRLSPHFVAHGITDEQMEEDALYLAHELTKRGIAYLHAAEPGWAGDLELSNDSCRQLCNAFKGMLIVCGQYMTEEGEQMITSGLAGAVVFNRPLITNPDLVAYFRAGTSLSKPGRETFYGGQEKGCTGYPTLEEAA